MNLAIVQALALSANLINIGNYEVVDLGLQHPFYCGIMQNPVEGENIAEVVQTTFDVLDRSFMWICDVPIREADNVFSFPEMELPLDKLVSPKKADATFEIISSQDMSEWKYVVAPVFDFTKKDIDAFAKLYQHNKNFYHMVARVDGLVVGAGTLQIYGDTAILHNITTLPAARGKGIGSCIAYELLKYSIRLGCRKSCIHGSAKAEKMYKRLGYQTKKIAYANYFIKK